MLFNGFSVFDGFLSVILSSVISRTGGMVMCFSSSQVSILHLQKDLLILFSFGCFFGRILSCFCHTNVFNMLFPCIQVFSQTSVTGQQLALWLLRDLLFSIFGRSYITSFRWVLLFQNNSAVIHKVAQCVIPT